MKIIVTEAQLKNLINEQTFLSPLSLTTTLMTKKLVEMEPHERNNVLAIGALFIPYVGPYLSAGISAYDASLYYKQGKKTEAALTLLFGVLPEISAVVNKIPGVKELGKKGMAALASKIAKGVRTFSPAEVQIVKGINIYKDLIRSETEVLLKKVVKPGVHVADYQAKELLKDKAIRALR